MSESISAKRSRAESLILWAGWASVSVATLLFLAKIFAWFWTGSVGVLASLVDSMLDLFASGINLLAIRYAMLPPDREHRFGHGKAEALAGLGQAIFIASSSVFLLMFAIERIIHPELIESPEVGTSVIAFSIVMTLVLVSFQRYVVGQTGSVAIKADSIHYTSDLLTNLGVLLGLTLYYRGWLYSDQIIGLVIAAYILYSALRIGYRSVQLLLDHALPEEMQARIVALALAEDGVIEVHELRTRESGRVRFIQLHLVMDGALSLSDAHEVGSRVEAKLHQEFENLDVLIHHDPHTKRLNDPFLPDAGA